MTYKLMKAPDGTQIPTVIRKSDGVAIPFDNDNMSITDILDDLDLNIDVSDLDREELDLIEQENESNED